MLILKISAISKLRTQMRAFKLRLTNALSSIDTEPKRRIVSNIGWLVFDKGIMIIDGLLVGAAVARYLGPRQYGMLATASAVCALIATVVGLGYDSVIVRRLVSEPDNRPRMLWTVAVTRTILGALAFALVALYSIARGDIEEDDGYALILIATSIPLLTTPFATFRLLLEAEIASKWQVWTNNSLTVIAAVIKLIMVSISASPLIFALITATTSSLATVSLVIIVQKLRLLPAFQMPSWREFKILTTECWPLLLTTLSISLYMNADIIMLDAIHGTTVAGIYSVATRLSIFWYFIPIVIGSSLFPYLVTVNTRSQETYRKRFQWYMDINGAAAIGCMIVALTTFPTLVRFLFGRDYESSIAVFYIHIWAVPFVFLGVARGQHLTISRMHKFNMWTTLMGFLTNIILNFLLIPNFGANGAAVATVCSYALSAYLSSFLIAELRWIGWLQTQSIISAPWRLFHEPSA